MRTSLFRREAEEHATERNALEPILLTAPLPIYILALFVGAALLGLLAFALLATLPRFEQVQGYLDADKGVINVFGIGDGTVKDLEVELGQEVRTGDILFRVEQAGTGDAIAGAKETTLRHLLEQRALVERTLAVQHRLAEDTMATLEAKKRSAERELVVLLKQQRLLDDQGQTLEVQLDRLKNLNDQGYASAPRFEEALLAQQKAAENSLAAERDIVSTLSSIEEMSHRIREAQSTRNLENLASQKAALEIETRINELGNKQVVVVRSSVDGIVASINTKNGQRLEINAEVMRILPHDSALVARFPVPSAAIGLIGVGQLVQLRYAAFPYQKYGVQQGKVTSISPTAMRGEVGSSQTAADARDRRFIVVVALESDHVIVSGKPRPLLPDMAVEGAILLEKRSIMEWLLEPLLAARSRL